MAKVHRFETRYFGACSTDHTVIYNPAIATGAVTFSSLNTSKD